MKLFWLAIAGLSLTVAALLLVLREFTAAFVTAAVGMIAWFLNYRIQMKELIERSRSGQVEATKVDAPDDDY